MDGWSVRGRHLPALDGLRALAVAAVVAYHLSYGWARGGYLGVDLFFVLSGFLITSLLLEEREATGSIRLAAFWGRRARRLLPALVVMVAAVMVFLVAEGREGNSAFVAGFDLVSLRPQAFAALFYYSNWWLIHVQQSYFTQFSTPSPFQHTWSLAIEEQFYLAWPFITLALAAKGLAARRRAGITAATVIAVGSAVLMAVLFTPGGDPSRLYYGTDTRIQDLAVGTLLAWLTARRPETPPRLARALTVVAPAALCGLLVLMAVAGTSSGPTAGEPTGYMFEGGFLVASVLSAIVIADVRREGSVLRAIFSWRPLVAIGLVSYGIYLWHWPVIVLLTPATVAGATGAGLLAVRLAVLAAAVLVSYFAIELPVRRGRLPRPAQWTVYPAAACAVVAAVVIGTTPSFVIKSYVRATLLRYAPTTPPTGSGGVAGQAPIDLGRAVSRSDPLRVVLVGDSMLNLAGPGVDAALEATGEVRATNRGFDGWGTSPTAAWRAQWRGYVARAVTSTRADVVFVTTGWDGGVAENARAYEATLRELVTVAVHAGARGVVFLQYPVTMPSIDVTPAALAATRRGNAAWNHDVAAMPDLLPGKALYFPIAGSVDLNGRFSYWLPPPRDPGAPMATWDRVRRPDGIHLCPPGIELYAAAIAADAATSFHLPAPAPGWWVDGWQRAHIIESGAEFCPADHPG